MERTSKQTDEPILLRWELTSWKKVAFACIRLLSLILLPLLAFSLLAYSVFGRHGSYDRQTDLFYAGILVLAINSPLFHLTFQTGTSFICANSGLVIHLLEGGDRRLPWSDIRSVRRGLLGITVLQHEDQDKKRTYLPIPPDAREKLIALLREASNARIIGFDSEAS